MNIATSGSQQARSGVDASLVAASCKFAAAVPGEWPACQAGGCSYAWPASALALQLTCLSYIYIFKSITVHQLLLSFGEFELSPCKATCQWPARLRPSASSPSKRKLVSHRCMSISTCLHKYNCFAHVAHACALYAFRRSCMLAARKWEAPKPSFGRHVLHESREHPIVAWVRELLDVGAEALSVTVR